LAVAAASGIASGVSLPFHDGFETVAVGDHPDETGWVTLFAGKDASVSDEVPTVGSNSFRLDSWSWTAAAEYVLLDEVPDQLSYETSVYVHPEDGSGGYVGFVESAGMEGLIWNCFHVDGVSGTVTFWGDEPSVLGDYAPGNWVTVRADLDYQDQTADVWLNGEPVLVDVPITPKQFSDVSLGDVVLDKLTLVSSNKQNGFSSIFSNLLYFDEVKAWVPEDVMTVDIDVKPGEDPNPINCSSRGLVPVAVMSSPEFDAGQIDVPTVELAGAGVAVRGCGAHYMAHSEDVDGDGLLDMVLHFDTQSLDVEQLDAGVVVLTGSTTGGGAFQGTDEVVLVGRCARCRLRR
jgi:hypothetical protein